MQAIIINRKWIRSKEGVFAGVFSGLSKSFKVEAWILRILFLVFTLLTSLVPGILVYFMCYLCLPREDQVYEAEEKKLLGVCYRISRLKKLEIGLVRLIVCSTVFLSFGLAVVGYLVFYVVLPTIDEIYP